MKEKDSKQQEITAPQQESKLKRALVILRSLTHVPENSDKVRELDELLSQEIADAKQAVNSQAPETGVGGAVASTGTANTSTSVSNADAKDKIADNSNPVNIKAPADVLKSADAVKSGTADTGKAVAEKSAGTGK